MNHKHPCALSWPKKILWFRVTAQTTGINVSWGWSKNQGHQHGLQQHKDHGGLLRMPSEQFSSQTSCSCSQPVLSPRWSACSKAKPSWAPHCSIPPCQTYSPDMPSWAQQTSPTPVNTFISLILPLVTRHTAPILPFPTSPLHICLPRRYCQLQCHTVYLFFSQIALCANTHGNE